MKSRQLSWGFFLITIGALFLLTKYEIIKTDFSFVWNIWPFIFIIWGGIIIFKNSLIRPILSAIAGIYFAVMLYGIIANIFSNFDWYIADYTEIQRTYSEDFNDSIKYAELEFNSGAGAFEITEPDEKLIYGESHGSWADYKLETSRNDSTCYIDFHLSNNTFNLPSGKIKNHLTIKLNEKPIWDMNFNFGAAKAKFDLSYYKVRNIQINTGASNVILKLGDKYDNTNVDIEMGASKIRIYVPENSGCRLEGDMVLMARDLDGLKKIDSELYETPNYEYAQKRVSMRINGGVSSFKIIRY